MIKFIVSSWLFEIQLILYNPAVILFLFILTSVRRGCVMALFAHTDKFTASAIRTSRLTFMVFMSPPCDVCAIHPRLAQQNQQDSYWLASKMVGDPNWSASKLAPPGRDISARSLHC